MAPLEGGLENGEEVHICISLQSNQKGSNNYLLSYLEYTLLVLRLSLCR